MGLHSEKGGGVAARGEETHRSTAFPSSSASNGNTGVAAMAQYKADARLFSEFEQSGKSFNYRNSVVNGPKIVGENVGDDEMNVYLSRLQRGGLIQPFGCLLAIHELTFKIIAFSKNCCELLGFSNLVESGQLESLLGTDVRNLFTPSSRSSLVKAVASIDISVMNPLWVHSTGTNKPFYAILHRNGVGIVIDLEPADLRDPTLLLTGAVQSHKLAVKAISRLQALPGGDIGVLCDTLVEDIQKLTGYDRVMVYKFHDDEHGEVVSEIRRSDLEPYLGLHYPVLMSHKQPGSCSSRAV